MRFPEFSPLLRGTLAALLTLGLSACASLLAAPEFPPADLDAPGWTIRTGQALWQPAAEGAPRLAGELLVARHDGGDVLVNFVKPPLPLFTARIFDGDWRIRFVERDREYSGWTKPPKKRFIWFALPEIIDGGEPPAGWRIERDGEDAFELKSTATPETLRVALDG